MSMERARRHKTFVLYQITRRHVLEESIFNSNRRENVDSADGLSVLVKWKQDFISCIHI